MRHLFIFAHPDDDVLIAGTMYELVREGHEVQATWVTDTDTMGGTAARQDEARAVARLLGLHAAHFLNLPSCKLHFQMDAAQAAIAEHVAAVAPEVITCVAYEGGHVDHDLVSLLVSRAAGAASLREYPLYSACRLALRVNRFAPGGPAHHLRQISWRGVARKLQCMWIYRSQWPFMVPAAVLTLLRRRVEPWREVPSDRDYGVPPHPGLLNVDRWLNRWMGLPSAAFRELARESQRGGPGAQS